MRNKIPSLYKKEDSNIGKLLELIEYEISKIKNVFSQIQKYRNIDNAEGVTLELLGSNVGEKRGDKSEQLYRQYILTKMKGNLSGGQIEALIDILNLLTNNNVKSIVDNTNEPASIIISFNSMENEVPISALKNIVAAGVNIIYEYGYMTWDEHDSYYKTWDEWDNLGLTWNEYEVYREVI